MQTEAWQTFYSKSIFLLWLFFSVFFCRSEHFQQLVHPSWGRALLSNHSAHRLAGWRTALLKRLQPAKCLWTNSISWRRTSHFSKCHQAKVLLLFFFKKANPYLGSKKGPEKRLLCGSSCFKHRILHLTSGRCFFLSAAADHREVHGFSIKTISVCENVAKSSSLMKYTWVKV